MSSPELISAEDALKAFRSCLGQFATGVTVVTCSAADGHPCGITANSFSSVSLEPPLILWNIAKSSNSLDAYLEAESFAIHVLTEEQEELSSHFAKSDHTLFADIDYSDSDAGAPILPNCLAVLECSTQQIHDCGDHYIIIGHVDQFSVDDAEPLLFFDGRYQSLA